MDEKISVLLPDDDTEFCARMTAVLDSADDFELVGIAENGEKALSAVNELRPDVLIIELMLPVMDGMSVLSRLHGQDGPPPAVLVFSAVSSPQLGAERPRPGGLGGDPRPGDGADHGGQGGVPLRPGQQHRGPTRGRPHGPGGGPARQGQGRAG